ncbi:Phosphoglucosamine mutase [Methanococcus maripaludis X1]|uniref:Phosphoglucosamine mutase n=1 Tax=Methanococcus maripaludis X1 TaxID=1053692 RepID=G0H0M8_METMI|nr:Phosphoglucosamine mutase [Methanococcus maripaludis X1]
MLGEILKLFGTSGIRMKNLDPLIAYKVGFAISKNFKKAVIGRDTRTTGNLIESAITAGLLNGGCDVTTIGMVPTPVLGYSAKDYDLGIMITASHNPPEYNGIKLFNKNGTAFDPQQEKELENIIENDDFNEGTWDNIGCVVEDKTAVKKYFEYILQNLNLNTNFNVVVDCANAAGCVVSPNIFTEAGCKVISVNSHCDGRFVGRMPEPNETNLKETVDIIKGLNSNGRNYVGIAHDGDADRMIAIDELGRVTDFDKLLAAFCKYLVQKTGADKIVTTVDASMAIEEYLNEFGAKVIRTKIGDVAVAEELEKTGAIFGGEPSGTWIHRDIHLTPDGILSGLRVLEMMEFYGKKLHEIIDEVPSYANMREKISCPDNLKQKVMDYVSKEGEKIFKKKPETLEGVRFSFEKGWILIRLSGTESYVRVRVEAKEKDFAEKLMKTGISMVKKGISGK